MQAWAALKQEVNNMLDTHENRRKSDRRKSSRRMDGMPYDALTNKEKQLYDEMLWRAQQVTDRRAEERRSGEDRRKG